MAMTFCVHGHQVSTCPRCNRRKKCDKCGRELWVAKETLICPQCSGNLIEVFPGISDFLINKPHMLFVDDRSKRIHYALDVYGKNYNVTIAPNVPEALRLLASQEWDVVSLDHDLNGHDFEDPESTGCGMEIVRYIQKCGGWPTVVLDDGHFMKRPEFWIHSKNIFAAHLMIITLHEVGMRAYWRPINYKTENMKYDEKGLPI